MVIRRHFYSTIFLLSLLAAGFGCKPKLDEAAQETKSTTGQLFDVEPKGGFVPLGTLIPIRVTMLGDSPGPSPTIVYASNNAATINVDSKGNLSAAAPGGATITVSINGRVRSFIFYSATIPTNSILVSQEEIVGEPEFLDDEMRLGAQFEVELDGPSPLVGHYLIGTGDVQLAGKIVSVEGSKSTVEVVGLDEIFVDLELNEVVQINRDDLALTPELAEFYSLDDSSDGGVLTLRRHKTLTEVTGLTAKAIHGGAHGTRALGPFECAGTILPPFQLDALPLEIKVKQNLAFVVDYSFFSGLKDVGIKGDLSYSTTIKAKLTGNLKTKFECSKELFVLTIPVGGPVSMLIGGVVPVGAGFTIGGSIDLVNTSAEISGLVAAKFATGVKCDDLGCNVYATLDAQGENTSNLVPPAGNLASNLVFKPEIGAFLYADLSFGSKMFKAFRYNGFKMKSGVYLKGDLALRQAQVNSNTSAKYEIVHVGSVGTAKDVQKLFGLLSVTALKLEYTFEDTWGRSPEALTVRGTSNKVCELELKPDDINFPSNPIAGPYNVDQVRLYHSHTKADGTHEMYLVDSETAQNGQTRFDLSWAQAREVHVTHGYEVFVYTKSLPLGTLGEIRLGRCTEPAGSILSTGIYQIPGIPVDGIVRMPWGLASGRYSVETYTNVDGVKGCDMDLGPMAAMDTVLSFVDSDGNIVASNDDSGIGACSWINGAVNGASELQITSYNNVPLGPFVLEVLGVSD